MTPRGRSMPEVVTRPNGKLYRPRKGLRQIGYWDDTYGESRVVVLGTHDIEKARAFATPYECEYLVEGRKCWAKSVMRNGERFIATDATERGAAAVDFRESDEQPT